MGRKRIPTKKKPFRKKKVNRSIYVPNEDLCVTEWIPSSDHYAVDINTNNWFDFRIHSGPNFKDPGFTFGPIPMIPKESHDQQMKTIKRRKLDKEPVFITSKKVQIYPDSDQHQILQQWFNAFAHMFNITINYLRSKIKKHNIDFRECSRIVNFESIRTILYPDKLDIQENMSQNQIPIHILDEAIHQAVSNYKTCLTNLKLGHIRKFRIREWSKNRRRKIIRIESNFFKNDTFCPTTFPQMAASESLEGIDSTVTLQYDSDTGKYILFIPVKTEPKLTFIEKYECGIDLGVRAFATVFSSNSTSSICNDSRHARQIKNCQRKIDKIHELLQLSIEEKMQFVGTKIKNGNKLELNIKGRILNRSKLRRGLRKYEKRIRDLVQDMHYKVAKGLVTVYGEIYIGKLSTSSILSRNNVTITKATKRMISVLSPYRFRQRLKHMGNKYGSVVIEVDEYKTTKTCSQCGNEKDLKGSKVYECECGMKADRDENAAKNILKVGIQNRLRPLVI